MQPTDPSYIVPPFPAFPAVSRYVALGSVQEAMGRVCRSIEAQEAISLVIGPPGTGKSLLCGLLVEHFRSSHEVVIVGETPIENRAAFLRHLLHHLGADFTSIRDGDLQLALVDRVCNPDAPSGGLLIVIDEAQSLPAEVLEAVRMVTNISRSGQPRVSAVLCGGVKLDDTLVDRSLESFVQRIATRCYLHPMNSQETRRYVAETITACGANPDTTITDEAIAAVHHACSGVPRLINQMMTHAIDCAEEADQSLITEQIIDRAWAQLQQLPSPMIDQPKISHKVAPIEFGELQDDDIQVETDTAIWMDDDIDDSSTQAWQQPATATRPVAPPAAASRKPAGKAVPSKNELFGQFDSEEDVTLGAGVTTSKLLSTPSSANLNATADLEAMLHQELIGLPNFDANLFTAVEQIPAMDQGDESSALVRGPQEQVLDFIADDDRDSQHTDAQEDAMDCDETPAVLSFRDRDDAACDDIELCRDDSDLLVIEDEIELTRCDAAETCEGKQHTIAVDFQAMLSRMRTGS